MVQNPYPIVGLIFGAGAGITVTATNARTGETLTEITVSDSSYVIDCANFTSGYAHGDLITIAVLGSIWTARTTSIDTTNSPGGRLLSLTSIAQGDSSAFDVFNWPYSILKIAVTPGYTNQTTGGWVAESTVETAISAHISDVSIKELSAIDPGIVAKGVRNLSCNSSVNLEPLDRVRITELDGTLTEWEIHAKKLSTGLLARHAGISRETFILQRRA